MDWGVRTTGSLKSSTSKKTIQFDDSSFYWRTDLNGIWFGAYENGKFGLQNEKITVETGLQCLYIPESHYDNIYN